MSNSISGKTIICGVIGDPIEHTMSPVMHNAAFSKLGLDYVYVAFRVKSEELGGAIAGMRAFNIRGLNVTIPHKVAVMPLLDVIDPLAEKIGAVNTIVNDNGHLTGLNTDASGFLRALLEKDIEPEGKKVVVLGAGGAARAICFSLADRGASLVILNRVQEMDWAREIAQRVSQQFRQTAALELNGTNLAEAVKDAQILVHATSVGMSPDSEKSLVPAPLLRPDLTVFDVVYNPVDTRLLKEAKAAGAVTVSGLDMLVWQGALAFERWTGQQPPAALMKKEALKRLQKDHEK